MNRRGFLGAMLAAAAAPAIVRAESLMKIVVPKKEIILADNFVRGMGDGDFTAEMWSSPSGIEWEHLVVVRNKGELLTYRNGKLVPPKEVEPGWMQISVRQGNGVTLDNTQRFSGFIHDVRLTQDHVRKIDEGQLFAFQSSTW